MSEPPTGPDPDPTQSQPTAADGQPAEPARGSHRGRRKPSSVALPVLLALALAVVGFIVVWVWLGLGSGSNDASTLPPAGDPATASVTPTESATSPTAPNPSPTTSSSPKPTTKPSSEPSKTDKPEPTKTSKPEPSRDVTVVVFNQTSVTGLAARFAARLEVAGWDVVGVANWIGTVPATTVYYQPGDEAAARALMADFPDVGRIHPAVSNMPNHSLTVVLTSDFPTG